LIDTLLNQRVVRVAVGAWHEVAWISAGQIVGALGAIVGVHLLTTLLTPAAYGEFALGLTSATLVFQVVLGPLVNAYERYFAATREAGRGNEFFAAARQLTTRSSAVILAVGLLVCAGLWLVGQTAWLPLTLLAVLFALLSGWESVLDSLQNAARHRVVVATHQAVRLWLRPALAAWVLVSFGATSALAMGAYALASALVLASQLVFFRRAFARGRATGGLSTYRPDLQRQLLVYAMPFGIWGLFTWMQSASDRWALQVTRSSAEVGIYAIVLQLGAYPITLIGTMLTQVAAPIIFAEAGDAVHIQRITDAVHLALALVAAVVLVTLVLAGVSFVASGAIFALLVGEQFREASGLLWIAVLASGCFVAGQLLSLVPMALGDSRALLAPKIWTAVLAVALNLVAAYAFGVVGVLWAGFIFSLVYCGWVAIAARRLFSSRTRALTLAQAA
jgi:O-antigen/teichoic acid export membrane protein